MMVIVGLMMGVAACGHSPSAPTVQVGSQNTMPITTCSVPSISVDVNMAGPQLTIATPANSIVEVERFDNSGSWVKWGASTGNKPVDVWFDQKYRVRARHADCAEWSDWVVKVVGPANPCGGCIDVPTTPPPAPFSAIICTDWTFVSSVTQHLPINVPAGTYRVNVETKDAAHHLGYQPDQTQEVVTVQGIGTTEDIPERDTSHITSFNVQLPTPITEVIITGGRDSVHGVCITLQQVN